MLTQEQQNIAVNGINSADCVILLQVVDRIVQSGNLQGVELRPVADARDHLIAALEGAVGVNYDAARAQMMAQLRQQQAAAQAAQNEQAEQAELASEDTAEAPSS